MSLDERIREGLLDLITLEASSDDALVERVVTRGRRRRIAIVASTVAIAVVVASAGGLLVKNAVRVRHENAASQTPSPVLSASSTNIDGTAQVSSTQVRVNQIFTITTTITKFNGLSGFADIDTGDGRPHGGGVSLGCGGTINDRPLPTRRNSGIGSEGLDKHGYAYRNPGTYHVTVTFRVFRPCSNLEETAGPVAFDIVVTDGPHRSAGPFPPTLVEGGINEAGGQLHLDASFFGAHTWVSRVILDWGDGTHRIFDSPLSKCVDPKRYWPSSNAHVADRHAYAIAGPHTVTFTLTSSGCDGRSRRTTTIKHEFKTPLQNMRETFTGGRLL